MDSVAMRDGTKADLLPVAIMAHNEEKVIERAVTSVLTQEVPEGFYVKVVVVANGCEDRTEEIVAGLQKENPEGVMLLTIKEKGKTRAINRAIEFLDESEQGGLLIPYVVFLDADCEFSDTEGLTRIARRFADEPGLCAIGATCIPDVVLNSRCDIVSEIYRATFTLSQTLRVNSISGMCYGIRLETLRKIDFPEFQVAEDMYLTSRLNGWLFRDPELRIVFRTPIDIREELRRRARQEISTQRYHQYYSFLERNGVRVKLFEGSLGDEYKWWGATDNSVRRVLLGSEGAKTKIYVLLYFLIRLWAKIKARVSLIHMGKNADLDYWKVSR